MKKRIYLFIISLILTASNVVLLNGHKCGLEHMAQQLQKDYVAAFGKKYRKDPMVQAILKKDLKTIKRLSINPKTKLEVKVTNDAYKYKSTIRCNYIGLAVLNLSNTIDSNPLGTMDDNEHNRKKYGSKIKAFLMKEAGHLYSVINELIKKGVNARSVFMLDSYGNYKGKWRQAPSLLEIDGRFVRSFMKDYKSKRFEKMLLA